MFSDFWVEQGGYFTGVANQTKTQTLFRPFSNTKYSVFLTANRYAQDIWGHGDTVPPSNMTSSSFGIYVHSSGGNYNLFWTALGY